MLSHTGNMPPQDVLARLRKHAAGMTGNGEVLAAGARPLAGGRNNAVYEWASPDGPYASRSTGLTTAAGLSGNGCPSPSSPGARYQAPRHPCGSAPIRASRRSE